MLDLVNLIYSKYKSEFPKGKETRETIELAVSFIESQGLYVTPTDVRVFFSAKPNKDLEIQLRLSKLGSKYGGGSLFFSEGRIMYVGFNFIINFSVGEIRNHIIDGGHILMLSYSGPAYYLNKGSYEYLEALCEDTDPKNIRFDSCNYPLEVVAKYFAFVRPDIKFLPCDGDQDASKLDIINSVLGFARKMEEKEEKIEKNQGQPQV